MEFIYRYRPMKSILGEFLELERQEIYFAGMHELNDPMEGAMLPFYKGTEIHWIYLLKFYFMEVFEKYWLKYHQGIYTSKNHFDNILEKCLDNSALKQFVQEAGKAIEHYTSANTNRLFYYVVHPYMYYSVAAAVEHIYGNDSVKVRTFETQQDKASKLLSSVAKISFHAFLRPQDTVANEEIMKCHEYMRNQWKKLAFDAQDYSDQSALEDLFVWPKIIFDKFIACLCPRYRVASFSGNPKNVSMWSHYASAHNGVCLKFNIIKKNGQRTLDFEGDENAQLIFHGINYCPKTWDRALDILKFIDFQNTKEYLPSSVLHEVQGLYLQKNHDWKDEEEERLLIPDYGKERSKVRYRFSALESISFGVNTSYGDQYRVIDIIRQKCEEDGRKNFNFYIFNPDDDQWDAKPVYSI